MIGSNILSVQQDGSLSSRKDICKNAKPLSLRAGTAQKQSGRICHDDMAPTLSGLFCCKITNKLSKSTNICELLFTAGHFHPLPQVYHTFSLHTYALISPSYTTSPPCITSSGITAGQGFVYIF